MLYIDIVPIAFSNELVVTSNINTDKLFYNISFHKQLVFILNNVNNGGSLIVNTSMYQSFYVEKYKQICKMHMLNIKLCSNHNTCGIRII